MEQFIGWPARPRVLTLAGLPARVVIPARSEWLGTETGHSSESFGPQNSRSSRHVFADLHRDFLLLPLAQHEQRNVGVFSKMIHERRELRGIGDELIVDLLDHVESLHACFCRGSVRDDFLHDEPEARSKTELRRERGFEWASGDSEKRLRLCLKRRKAIADAIVHHRSLAAVALNSASVGLLIAIGPRTPRLVVAGISLAGWTGRSAFGARWSIAIRLRRRRIWSGGILRKSDRVSDGCGDREQFVNGTFHKFELKLLHGDGNEDDVFPRNLNLEPRTGEGMRPDVMFQSRVSNEPGEFLLVLVNEAAVFRRDQIVRDFDGLKIGYRGDRRGKGLVEASLLLSIIDGSAI